VRVAVQVEVPEVLEGLAGPRLVELSARDPPPQDLGHLEIDQVRSVQRFVGRGDALGDAGPLVRGEKKLQDRRGIEDDHRRLRSARTASAGAGRGRAGARFARRRSSSPRVGRSSERRSSISRYSDTDIPARAARAFSSRWSSSGTLRIWTIGMDRA
jgi:hypothetical protein